MPFSNWPWGAAGASSVRWEPEPPCRWRWGRGSQPAPATPTATAGCGSPAGPRVASPPLSSPLQHWSNALVIRAGRSANGRRQGCRSDACWRPSCCCCCCCRRRCSGPRPNLSSSCRRHQRQTTLTSHGIRRPPISPPTHNNSTTTTTRARRRLTFRRSTRPEAPSANRQHGRHVQPEPGHERPQLLLLRRPQDKQRRAQGAPLLPVRRLPSASPPPPSPLLCMNRPFS